MNYYLNTTLNKIKAFQETHTRQGHIKSYRKRSTGGTSPEKTDNSKKKV